MKSPILRGALLTAALMMCDVVARLVDMHIHVVGGTGRPGDGVWQQMTLLAANGVTTARSLAGAPTAARAHPRGSSTSVRNSTRCASPKCPRSHAARRPRACGTRRHWRCSN